MRMRFILLSFLLFISCDRRELTYYEVVGVTLMADWSQAGLEGEDTYGATAVFYPQNGGVPQTVLMGNRTHAITRLPKGHYNVIYSTVHSVISAALLSEERMLSTPSKRMPNK